MIATPSEGSPIDGLSLKHPSPFSNGDFANLPTVWLVSLADIS